MRRLQELREARGWSRAELARRADMNASTVGLIESGRFRPYDGQVSKLIKALELEGADAAELARHAGMET